MPKWPKPLRLDLMDLAPREVPERLRCATRRLPLNLCCNNSKRSSAANRHRGKAQDWSISLNNSSSKPRYGACSPDLCLLGHQPSWATQIRIRQVPRQFLGLNSSTRRRKHALPKPSYECRTPNRYSRRFEMMLHKNVRAHSFRSMICIRACSYRVRYQLTLQGQHVSRRLLQSKIG